MDILIWSSSAFMWHYWLKCLCFFFRSSVIQWVTIFEILIWISKVIIQPVKANRSWIKRAQGQILFANSTNQSPWLTERLACALNANKNSIQANVSSFYARLCIQEVCWVVTFLSKSCSHIMSTRGRRRDRQLLKITDQKYGEKLAWEDILIKVCEHWKQRQKANWYANTIFIPQIIFLKLNSYLVNSLN